MSEFPSIETLTAAKNAVERDRVIRETWEALVAAVGAYENRTYGFDVHFYTQRDLVNAAVAYVNARKGNV